MYVKKPKMLFNNYIKKNLERYFSANLKCKWIGELRLIVIILYLVSTKVEITQYEVVVTLDCTSHSCHVSDPRTC